MHEVHLVQAIVELVEKEAAAKHAKRVTLVRIRFNPLTSHSANHVQFSFDMVKNGSKLLRGATLTLNEVAPIVHCTHCSKDFLGHHLPDVCPRCGSLEVKAVNPTDMVLEGFEMEG